MHNNLKNHKENIPVRAMENFIQAEILSDQLDVNPGIALQILEKYGEILDIINYDDNPEFYANVEANMGFVYGKIPYDLERNLTLALEWFEKSLKTYNSSQYPNEYATILNDIGIIYDLFPKNRAKNVEKAITKFSESLKFTEPNSLGYAQTNNNLGIAYYYRREGNLSENFQKSLICYKIALEFFERTKDGMNYAETMNNIGNLYADRTDGDVYDNKARAVSCYETALNYRTPLKAPIDYATTQTNLGKTLLELPSKDMQYDIIYSISCFRNALEFLSPESHPLKFAETITSLGRAYLKREWVGKKENTEKAIECFNSALKYVTIEAYPDDYSFTHYGLGNAYFNISNYDEAIYHYNKALEVNTEDQSPFAFSTCQNNLGIAYTLCKGKNTRKNLNKAEECFKQALRYRSEEVTPYQFRRSKINLGNVYFLRKDWQNALLCFEEAVKISDKLYESGLSIDSKEIEVNTDGFIYHKAAFSAFQLCDSAKAFYLLEKGRARILEESLKTEFPRPLNVTESIWNEYLDALRTLQNSLTKDVTIKGNFKSHIEAYDLRERSAILARKELEKSIQEVRKYSPEFLKPSSDQLEFNKLLPSKTSAIITFCITGYGTVGFISCQGKENLYSVYLPKFTEDSLIKLLATFDDQGDLNGGWIGSYLSDTNMENFKLQMNKVLDKIKKHLLSKIVLRIPPEIDTLVIIPSGALFLLPLHAITISNSKNEYLCDKYKISYAPSINILRNTIKQISKKTYNSNFYGVIDPVRPGYKSNLIFSRYEGKMISKYFGNSKINFGIDANRSNIAINIKNQSHIHFSCHGSYNWTYPLKSGLMLADGTLTLEDLQNKEYDLSDAYLVTLSACETGMVDVLNRNPNEFVGIPAGIILAGVPCIVSSLWTVPDFSTAMLMDKFYNFYVKSQLDCVESLKLAQSWLRNLRSAEVAEYLRKCIDLEDKAELKEKLNKRHDYYIGKSKSRPAFKPFEHPFYWAPFIVTGVSLAPIRERSIKES